MLLLLFECLPSSLLAVSLLALLLLYRYIRNTLHRNALDSLPFRNLRGKTILLLAPALDSMGLELAQELSNRGAQLLVALPAGPTQQRDLQLVLLLRTPGSNESVFLENYGLDSSPKHTIEFARKLVASAQLPTNTSRLDALVLLPTSHSAVDQSFLLLNVLMPYLLAQIQSGPPLRVVDVHPSPERRSLWRTFQRHLGPNPPLVLVPSTRSSLDCLWAILAPLSQISPGLLHSRRKPLPSQPPLDQSLLHHHLASVESAIQSHKRKS